MDEIEKLKKEVERVKKISETKSDIISITAHQLRTSLSALKWILKMFIDEDVGKLNNEQNELIKKAYNSNERMLLLVNDLLTLNHSEDASIPYKFKKIDIIYLIEQTLFEFSGETNKKEIELIFLKPDMQIPLINCDEQMIRVVFQNLIENAIKYSNKDGKIFISVGQKDNNVQISVHDTGIGIKNEDKENIFKKFFRSPNAIEKDAIGSGLGLFTTKNIIEKHNGKIWFENGEGGGTTFFVVLPIT
ncbi:MAG: HAMP domain-containing sensor histidine kinase [Candidatus Paceibacterota bacterium]|jgi:signal transduction histidine kinase